MARNTNNINNLEKMGELKIRRFLRQCDQVVISNSLFKTLPNTQQLRHRGMFWLRKREARNNTWGWPDYTGALFGLRLELELKSPNGNLSPRQRVILRDLANKGCLTACIYNMDHLKYLLRRWFFRRVMKFQLDFAYENKLVTRLLSQFMPDQRSIYYAYIEKSHVKTWFDT
jgi:hypothetical protein